MGGSSSKVAFVFGSQSVLREKPHEHKETNMYLNGKDVNKENLPKISLRIRFLPYLFVGRRFMVIVNS